MDGAAGFIVAGLPSAGGFQWVVGLVLLYDLLAFAAQPLAGQLVDRTGHSRAALVLAVLLMGAALMVPGGALVSVGLAGAGSALFHVAGGSVVLRLRPGSAGAAGVFSAPGVVGLATGSLLAGGAGAVATIFFVVALGGLAVVFAKARLPRAAARTHEPAGLEAHDVIMMVLLGAVAVRSAVWTAWEMALHGEAAMLLATAVAAGVGKLLGGMLADRIGWRRWAVGALAMSAGLLALGPNQPLAFLVGIGLLQSTTPVLLAAASVFLPGREGLATGLVLGLGVAAGGVAVMLGLGPPITGPPGVVAVLALLAVALAWGLRGKRFAEVVVRSRTAG